MAKRRFEKRRCLGMPDKIKLHGKAYKNCAFPRSVNYPGDVMDLVIEVDVAELARSLLPPPSSMSSEEPVVATREEYRPTWF